MQMLKRHPQMTLKACSNTQVRNKQKLTEEGQLLLAKWWLQ
jgi:hypothetical protein